jgi:hypothetical protein
LTLTRLLRRLLADPGASAGMPDLVVWRQSELALWEVKSPGDALSDEQRAWLDWWNREGLAAGVVRVDAAEHRQTQLWGGASGVEPEASAGVVAKQKARASRRRMRERLVLLDNDGRRWQPESGEPAPGGYYWSSEPIVSARRWNGRLGLGAVEGWLRPVTAIHPVGLLALRCNRRGERSQRWYPVPRGWVAVLLVSEEADPEGGVRAAVSLLCRRSGWLLPNDLAESEAVVVDPEVVGQTPLEPGVWISHPDEPPFRPQVMAEGWGCAEELMAQLALLEHLPHCCDAQVDGGGIQVRIADGHGALWVCQHPRLLRAVLPWASGDSTPV